MDLLATERSALAVDSHCKLVLLRAIAPSGESTTGLRSCAIRHGDLRPSAVDHGVAVTAAMTEVLRQHQFHVPYLTDREERKDRFGRLLRVEVSSLEQ